MKIQAAIFDIQNALKKDKDLIKQFDTLLEYMDTLEEDRKKYMSILRAFRTLKTEYNAIVTFE